MRATVMYGAGDVRIETVPDATVQDSTDAVVRVTRACICASDLWPYRTLEHGDSGRVMGHEAIGIVDAVGADIHTIKRGDLVVMPFAFSDGTCIFCHDGLATSCAGWGTRPAVRAGHRLRYGSRGLCVDRHRHGVTGWRRARPMRRWMRRRVD